MGVLLSELLVPGWADSQSMIGIREVTTLQGEVDAVDLPCHTADPEIFFSEDMATIARAKQACSGCPLIATCLEGALSRQEPCGVWGGELFDNGRVVAQKRTVGRPRSISIQTVPSTVMSGVVELSADSSELNVELNERVA